MDIQLLLTLVNMHVYVYFGCVDVVIKCTCQLSGKGDDQIWLSTGIPVLVDKKPEQAEAKLKCSAWTCLDFVS